MSDQRHQLPGHGTMEDYTTPFLIVAGILCWMGLVVMWVLFGILGATLSAVAADRIIPRPEKTD